MHFAFVVPAHPPHQSMLADLLIGYSLIFTTHQELVITPQSILDIIVYPK